MNCEYDLFVTFYQKEYSNKNSFNFLFEHSYYSLVLLFFFIYFITLYQHALMIIWNIIYIFHDFYIKYYKKVCRNIIFFDYNYALSYVIQLLKFLIVHILKLCKVNVRTLTLEAIWKILYLYIAKSYAIIIIYNQKLWTMKGYVKSLCYYITKSYILLLFIIKHYEYKNIKLI